jgi:hypothetical protein
MGTRPVLVINPRSDVTFDALANKFATNSAPTPEALQRALRDSYPKAVVHERSLSSEPITWYVYRDRAWVQTG